MVFCLGNKRKIWIKNHLSINQMSVYYEGSWVRRSIRRVNVPSREIIFDMVIFTSILPSTICMCWGYIFCVLLTWAGAQHFLQDCIYAQQRLGSAYTFTHADQNLHCLPENILDPWLPTECPAKTLDRLLRCTGWQTMQMCSLIWITCSLVENAVARFIWNSLDISCR